MRTSVLDSVEIGEIAKRLADERLRAIVECSCRKPDDSDVIDSSSCPIHREGAKPAS